MVDDLGCCSNLIPSCEGIECCCRCENCKELKETLLRCSQCHEAKYCSKECQKKHWVQGGHKRSCKLVQKKVTIGPVGYADKWV
jgi:hypothetical protein